MVASIKSNARASLMACDPFGHARMQAYDILDSLDPDLDFAACSDTIKSQIADSSRVWSAIKDDVLGAELSSFVDRIPDIGAKYYYLKHLPVTFAFGYFLGSEIARILGGSPDQDEEGGILSALFNSFASLFDKICDNCPELYGSLATVSTREAILTSMTSAPSAYWETAATNEGNFALKVLFRLMGSYFERCHALLTIEDDESVVTTFRTTMIAAYDGELKSRDCLTDSNLSLDEIYSTLFSKSVLPSRLIFLTSLMTAGGGP